jgi:hypothetical protein
LRRSLNYSLYTILSITNFMAYEGDSSLIKNASM